jgi:hypothetical protein
MERSVALAGRWRSVRFAAVVSLLVHLALLPVALAALAM